MLALFESSAHPQYSPARAASSISYLDNIIRRLQLTVIDNNDPDVSSFKPHHVPSVKPRSGSGLKDLSEVFMHSAASRMPTCLLIITRTPGRTLLRGIPLGVRTSFTKRSVGDFVGAL